MEISIENVHSNFQKGNFKEVKKFFEPNAVRDNYYNSQHETAAFTSLKFQQIEIYEFLITKGVRLDFDENIEDRFIGFESKTNLEHLVTL